DHAFIGGVILFSGLFRSSGDNQGSAGFVDQNRINFIDDRVEVASLHESRGIELHVVAEIIKTELVIRAVDNVAILCLFALEVVHIMLNAAYSQAEEPVDFTHPLGIPLCQVIVNSNDVDALAGEGIQVCRQSRDQGLAFSGFHLGDHAAMEHHTADQLDVEVSHTGRAFRWFADDRECFDEYLLKGIVNGAPERFFLLGRGITGDLRLGKVALNELLELGGSRSNVVIGELRHIGLEGIYLVHNRPEALKESLVGAAENLGRY